VVKITDKVWDELNKEISRLSKEYAELKNPPKQFETEEEAQARVDQYQRDRHEKYQGFDSLGTDFKKKRDYVTELRKEVDAMKVKKRTDELIQKLKDQTITQEELLELQVLNSVFY